MIGGVLLAPVLLNLIAEPILHLVSFAEVGIVYSRGEAPGLGSFLYLIAYVVNAGFLWAAGWLGFHWYTNVLVLVLYTTGLAIPVILGALSVKIYRKYKKAEQTDSE